VDGRNPNAVSNEVAKFKGLIEHRHESNQREQPPHQTFPMRSVENIRQLDKQVTVPAACFEHQHAHGGLHPRNPKLEIPLVRDNFAQKPPASGYQSLAILPRINYSL
jgi:hypothetical protein